MRSIPNVKNSCLRIYGLRGSLFAKDAHQLGCGMWQASAAPGDKIDVARHVELPHSHFFHPAMCDFPQHTHARHNRHAHAHLHKALDAFDGRHFDRHVKSGAIAGEEFDDAAAERGFDDVGDESFIAKLSDIDFAFLGQSMLGRNDQGELIFQNLGGLELGVARHEGNGTEVQAIIKHFMRNIAREHAVDAHLHAGMLFAKLG